MDAVRIIGSSDYKVRDKIRDFRNAESSGTHPDNGGGSVKMLICIVREFTGDLKAILSAVSRIDIHWPMHTTPPGRDGYSVYTALTSSYHKCIPQRSPVAGRQALNQLHMSSSNQTVSIPRGQPCVKWTALRPCNVI